MFHEFKYKLDFYYQQALMYLLTLIAYAGIKGTFIESNFTLVFIDPIFFVISFFVISAFSLLLINIFRSRKLVISENAIVFQHRFVKKEISLKEIEWMYIGKERGVQTAGRSQIVIIKLQGRRRNFRIRVGRYERDKELVQLMEKISQHVPKRQKRFNFQHKKK
jgi:hypothetical protein